MPLNRNLIWTREPPELSISVRGEKKSTENPLVMENEQGNAHGLLPDLLTWLDGNLKKSFFLN